MSETTANPLKNLYQWTLELAEHPHAFVVLFFLSMTEAIFFPIPPDIMLLAMAVSMPHKALLIAGVCTSGSIIGAIIGYGLGIGIWPNIESFFFSYIPGFSEENFQAMASAFADGAFATIFVAGFSPLPFKIFTVTAGAMAVPFLSFLLGTIASRSLRYFILGGLIYWKGPQVKVWIDKYFNTLTIVGSIVVVLFFVLH